MKTIILSSILMIQVISVNSYSAVTALNAKATVLKINKNKILINFLGKKIIVPDSYVIGAKPFVVGKIYKVRLTGQELKNFE